MRTSNISRATASETSVLRILDNISEPAGKAVVPSNKQRLLKPVKSLTASRDLQALRLDTVRVLALALVSALDGDGEMDLERGQSINLRSAVQRFEENLIRSALKHTGGRQRRAARLLGMNVSSLNSRIKRYKLNPPEMID